MDLVAGKASRRVDRCAVPKCRYLEYRHITITVAKYVKRAHLYAGAYGFEHAQLVRFVTLKKDAHVDIGTRRTVLDHIMKSSRFDVVLFYRTYTKYDGSFVKVFETEKGRRIADPQETFGTLFCLAQQRIHWATQIASILQKSSHIVFKSRSF
ncbi:Uncharacterised protein [Burkholderia pseudomallei]|nr:hypothetical protein DIJ63_00400 [Burkholderia pseudomallei]CAK0043516.1 Uncharacterised protein [Burkholderia pseudomallei]CFB52776.1 Uncharacterised protein [Burkholderia pseudomallei]CFD93221.1 Uncharacterised protein [Burkholderia pseudomallei]CFK83018.1 Uncharacterised protein [Burkholderia pseudomallei]